MMKSKSLSLFLLFLLISPFLISLTTAIYQPHDATDDVAHKKAKTTKKSSSSQRNITRHIVDIISSLGAFGGKEVSKIIDEFMKGIQRTAELAASLGDPNVVNSINFLIDSLLESLVEANSSFKSEKARTVTKDKLAAYLRKVKETLIDKLKAKKTFSPLLLSQINSKNSDLIIDSLTELFSNVVDAAESFGFPIDFNKFFSVISMLSALKGREFVSTETFSHFADMPNQMAKNLETLLDQYVQPEQLEMVASMAKMFAATQASKRHHEEEEEGHEEGAESHDEL